MVKFELLVWEYCDSIHSEPMYSHHPCKYVFFQIISHIYEYFVLTIARKPLHYLNVNMETARPPLSTGQHPLLPCYQSRPPGNAGSWTEGS